MKRILLAFTAIASITAAGTACAQTVVTEQSTSQTPSHRITVDEVTNDMARGINGQFDGLRAQCESFRNQGRAATTIQMIRAGLTTTIYPVYGMYVITRAMTSDEAQALQNCNRMFGSERRRIVLNEAPPTPAPDAANPQSDPPF